VTLLLVASALSAPLPAQETRTAVAPPPREARAPLAAIDDLEPAVDVGGESPAIAPRVAPGAAAQTAPPGAAPAPAPRERTVMDTLDLGTTSITGNQELPKVLYIVPWKKSDLGDLVGRPVNTLLDEVLAPVDPEVFERHLQYYETLHRVSEEE
jgi:hypothetical protein